MREAQQPGEEMSRMNRIRPKIHYKKSCWVGDALEEMTNAVVRKIARWADVWSLLVNDCSVRIQSTTKARAELGEGCSPVARQIRFRAVDCGRSRIYYTVRISVHLMDCNSHRGRMEIVMDVSDGTRWDGATAQERRHSLGVLRR